MKKLFRLSLALFVGAAMFAACSDDGLENIPEQNEVVVEPFIVKDTSVTIECRYRPSKSVVYQLQIGNSVSEKYSKGRFLKILNLSPDHEYTVKAMIFDADQKTVGMSKTNFKTTKSSSPVDQITVPKPIVFEEQDM